MVAEDALLLIDELLDTVVITVELAGLLAKPVDCGEVKFGLKQLVDPFSLLGVAKRSSLETASKRLSLLLSVVLGEVPEVVTSDRPMVLESGMMGEFKFLNSDPDLTLLAES